MLPRFQPRFRRTPHLAGLQTLNFTPYGFVFLDDFLFPLYPLGMNGESENSRLNTESERCFVLKENGDTVKTCLDVDFHTLNDLALDLRKVLLCCTHGYVLETYYSRFDLDILRLMFMECPHKSENGLAQGFGKYGLKRRCFKATWRTRSGFGSPMFQALRLPKKNPALKSLRCLPKDWTYRLENYSGISDSGSVKVIHFGNQFLVFQRLCSDESLDRIAEQVRVSAVVEAETHLIA